MLDSTLSTDLGFSVETTSYLEETSKWAKFLAIVGFVYLGLGVLGILSMGVFSSAFDPLYQEMGIPMLPFLLFYVAIIGIMFIPILYLYRFATNLKTAIQDNDASFLTDAFKNLKSHYKFYGIFVAIFLAIYGFFLAIGLLMGMGSFFM